MLIATLLVFSISFSMLLHSEYSKKHKIQNPSAWGTLITWLCLAYELGYFIYAIYWLIGLQ